MNMHITRILALSAFFATSLAEGQQNKPLADFHASIIKKGSQIERAMSPEIISSENPHIKPYAAIIQSDKWPAPNIPVCWENPTSANEQGRKWTQDAVTATWQSVSKLKFTGWENKCATVNRGIRIQIADVGPHVKTLGQYLDKMKNGMVLNFSFANWSQNCQSTLEHCIRAIAVHEFGHAIGLTHEQNRADAPGECRLLAQGSNPDAFLTPYDPDSVMNYCNKKWNNDGFLSTKDKEAAWDMYGKS